MWLSNLCVSTGVPVWVINDDSIGSSQIDSQTSDFSGQQEDKNGFVLKKKRKKKREAEKILVINEPNLQFYTLFDNHFRL